MRVKRPPLLDHDPTEPTLFRPENLLEGARRQKGLPAAPVPAGCLLDIDGELLDHLLRTGGATADGMWPCFHTKCSRALAATLAHVRAGRAAGGGNEP